MFSSIAKGASNRAESNLEIVQLLKASVTSHGMAKGGASKKKKHQSATTKQILSSMGAVTPLNVMQTKSNVPLNAAALSLHTAARQQSGKKTST